METTQDNAQVTTQEQPAADSAAVQTNSTSDVAAAMRQAAQADSNNYPDDIPATSGTRSIFDRDPAPQPEAAAPAEETTTDPAPAATATEPATTAAPSQDYNAWLAEQTGGKVGDLEGLKKLLEDPLALLPAEDQQLLKVFKSGMDVVEYQQFQSTDFDAMEPLELLRYDFERENKNVPAELMDSMFNRYVNKEYPNLLDPLGEGDSEYEADKFLVEQRKVELAEKYNAKKEEMKIISPAAKEAEGLSPEQYDQHLKSIQSVTTKTDPISFEVKAGGELRKLTVPVEQIPDLVQKMDRPDIYFQSRWSNPDQTFNYEKQQRDIDILERTEKYLAAAYEAGLNSRESQVLQTLENPSATASVATPNTESTVKDIAAAMRKAVQNANMGVEY